MSCHFTLVAASRLAKALCGIGLLVLGAGPAGAQVPSTTVPDVLVPGATTPDSAPATTTTVPDDGGLLSFTLDANQKVWIIVGGLIVVAMLILILTIVYWRHTKPDRPERDRSKSSKREKRDKRDTSDKREPTAGPADLDEMLGAPDPARSVFAPPSDPDRPGR